MELTLSDDQELLRDTTRRFLSERAAPAQLREWRHHPLGCDPGIWREGVELGWTSLLVDEAAGGGSISGEGLMDLAFIAHEFGRQASPGPLLSVNVVAAALSRFGTSEQKSQVLPSILGGGIATWCHAEPTSNDSVATQLCRRGDGHVLSGRKSPVEQGGQAEHFLVSAQSESGIAQVLVPRDAPGMAVTPLESVDLTRRFSEVAFDSTPVPRSAVVGELGNAAADIEWQLQIALVIQLHEMVGAMEKSFEMTLEWAFDRYSFGRPLASYQELKHRFADMKCWLEASHGLVNAATRAVQRGRPDAAELVSAAKSYIAHHGTELCQDCVQIHGGLGITFEHDLHLYLRRVTLGAVTHGTIRDHRLRLADLLEGEEAD